MTGIGMSTLSSSLIVKLCTRFFIATDLHSADKMSSSKAHAATILELTTAYDEAKNKRYKKGKFLGKVSRCIYFIHD